jgi:N-acetyl-gamma-glutamyl-phosphate reductase
MASRIFIDGEVGTTGLEIRERLAARKDLEFIRLDDAARKDPRARKDALNSADIAILCLPDDAAREAVSLIENSKTRVLDASTAFRTHPEWTYGFPEIGLRDEIRRAPRVSNPGCWPTGAIALIRPLVKAGLVPAAWPVSIHGVSGYSGGGKSMIAAFENPDSPGGTHDNFRSYALTLQHKHVPELHLYSGLANPPLFSPAVGRFYRGMLVEVPLVLWALPAKPALAQIHETIAAAYAGARFVSVVSLAEDGLDAEGVNNTNMLKLFVFGNEKRGQARLMAQLDNLGKGASGAAVQNLNLMLGVDEATGLS